MLPRSYPVVILYDTKNVNMPITDLPAELLTSIFEIAVENMSIYNLELPTSMALSSWEDRRDEWVLVEPMESLYIQQRSKYRVTKVRY